MQLEQMPWHSWAGGRGVLFEFAESEGIEWMQNFKEMITYEEMGWAIKSKAHLPVGGVLIAKCSSTFSPQHLVNQISRSVHVCGHLEPFCFGEAKCFLGDRNFCLPSSDLLATQVLKLTWFDFITKSTGTVFLQIHPICSINIFIFTVYWQVSVVFFHKFSRNSPDLA